MKKLILGAIGFILVSVGIATAVNTYPPYPGPRNSSAVFLVDSGSTVYPPLPSPRNSSPVFLVDPSSGLPTGQTLSAPVKLDLTSCPTISAPCNYTVPPGVTLLRGVGGGAGGAGGGVSAAAATGAAGLPGVILNFVMVVTPGQIISYTIGVGGIRGTNTGGTGGIGGDTLFGGLTFKGGTGGLGSTSGNAVATNAPIQVAIAANSFAMTTGSILIPTATTFTTGMSGSVAYNGLAGATGVGGQGKGLWGSSTPGINGGAVDCVGYNAAGSGGGSTTNTAGGGAAGCGGVVLLY